ncbi:hypothetical protein BABINDRAFT_163796 [Babjeviella inositovora NRRL Y-12698]|uniref:MARVEL domain-containing protein n=1 Tax=Babjeviella inositovora NRRL Y-12698 TaxID=984486 RepID=A0A1E3QH76_9ASCO|nr:uncharacterized protein BABINDRAFT_163796 [Babjeviella inositovora NRRL Y-12698]ODQ77063.1 hypothetical protein BABINDRAFT_163796 [Babjeviella inositovora NRRL Y-12698]
MGVISLVYILYVVLGTFYIPRIVPAGVVLILEGIIMILWFSAFVAIADLWGGFSCGNRSNFGGFFGNDFFGNDGFFGNGFSSACKAGKTSIAFSCFAWLAFLVSFVVIIINYLRQGTGTFAEKFNHILSRGGLNFSPGVGPSTVGDASDVHPAASNETGIKDEGQNHSQFTAPANATDQPDTANVEPGAVQNGRGQDLDLSDVDIEGNPGTGITNTDVKT